MSIQRFGHLLLRLAESSPKRPRLLATILLAFLGEVLFRTLDWTLLQTALRTSVLGLLGLFGLPTDVGPSTLFFVDGIEYDMTARCTYADFLCLTTAFMWRSKLPCLSMTKIAGWWFAVLGFVTVRISLACVLTELNVPWAIGHNAIDYSVRIILLLAVIFAWLETEVGGAEGP